MLAGVADFGAMDPGVASSASALHASSPQAHAIIDLLVVGFVVCLGIFALVAGLVAYCAVKFRAKPGDAEPRQVEGNTRLEIAWTVLPICLLIALFTFTLRAMKASDPEPIGEPEIVVIGHQWWWEAQYTANGTTTANEIHIPARRKVLVRLESADVIHDFWVPELARKVDAIPGHTNYVWLEADTVGTYSGVCAEYCGTQHTWMRLTVVADPEPGYQAWLADQKKPAIVPRDGPTARGATLFRTMTCRNCHAISGTASQARVAPDLTHMGSRRALAAGALDNTHDNLVHWLLDPAFFKPGSRMPNLHLTEDQASDLAAYLATLQ